NEGERTIRTAVSGISFALFPSLHPIVPGKVEPMKRTIFSTMASLLLAGCAADEPISLKQDTAPKTDAAPTKKVEVGKNVYLQIQGEQRRVLVETEVCLR